MRWLVETTKNQFEDVGADLVGIAHGGALVFTDSDTNLEVAYAPGQWLTVTRDDSDD